MSIITVATYRTMSGDSTTSDAAIQAALDRYTALIEGFTQRAFSLQAYEERYLDVDSDPIQLNHYPINEITEVATAVETSDGSDLQVHKATGLVYHEGAFNTLDVTITYSAGYDDAPQDIQEVIATLVEGYLDGVSGGTNELQAARKETVMGVATVDYGTPAQMEPYGTPYAELGPYTSILERYKAISYA